MHLEAPQIQKQEKNEGVADLIEAWLAKQAIAEGLFNQFGKGTIPQERYQQLQNNLEQRQGEAAAVFEKLLQQPGVTLAAVAERRKEIAASYKKGLQHTAKEQEGAVGQKLLNAKLNLLDKLEEEMHKRMKK